VQLFKLFSAFRNVAETAIVKFRIGSLKRIGMNKFVRTTSHNSHTGSKFSKRYWGVYMRWIVVVHLYCGFSLRRQMAPQQTAKFWTAFLVIFTSVLKDSLANYESISTAFATSVRGMSVRCNALNVSYFRL